MLLGLRRAAISLRFLTRRQKLFITGGLIQLTYSSASRPSIALCNCSCSAPVRAFDYDLLVIGGGSGGLACAKEGIYAYTVA